MRWTVRFWRLSSAVTESTRKGISSLTISTTVCPAGHTVVEIVNDDMPFLVDSVTAELNRQNLTVHLIIHPVIGVARSGAGKMTGIADDPKSEDAAAESIMHLQITEQTDERGRVRPSAR